MVVVQFQVILQIHGIGMPITMVSQKHVKVVKVVKLGGMDVVGLTMNGINVNLVYVEIIQHLLKKDYLYIYYIYP